MAGSRADATGGAQAPLGRALYWRLLAANAIGATLAFVYLTIVAPPQPEPPHGERVLYLGVAPLYVVLAALCGDRLTRRRVRSTARWLGEHRPPTEGERRDALSLPLWTALLSAAWWTGAAALFGAVTATHHPAVFVLGVVLGVVLAGLTTAAATFLLCERRMRPVFSVALAGRPSAPSGAAATLGTGPRLLASWALGSAVALVAIAAAFLGRADERGAAILPSVLFLVVVGLLAGGALIAAAARSVAEPIECLREAVEQVERGSLDEEVVVDDGGEIGRLQAGFNRMLAGLRERERIRQAFGTYVDPDVADHILREGIAVEGEEVEVTVMFLDVRGFTGLAERLPAREVVATLNRLLELVVPVIHRYGGHVDKFVGDGLLAVFGAPRRQDDHADRALAAAQAIAADVEGEIEGLSIGIGLNSGTVIAGNVGGAGRLEFSVIGDAVNVAARIEAATRETGDILLLSEHTRALLAGPAVAELGRRPSVPLKGKTVTIELFGPDGASDAADRE